MKISLVSYAANEYKNIGQKRVQLISNNRVCTMEEVDRYFGDVLKEYNSKNKSESIIEKVLSIKDKVCQKMKRK